jgi:hypothetical protein
MFNPNHLPPHTYAVTDDVEAGWVRQPDGSFAPRAPSPEESEAEFTRQIQQRLDAFAQTRGYDNILSACTYASSLIPGFAAEGRYCAGARDATWAAAWAILNAVEAGNRPMPGSIADIEADLPALQWPEATA